MSDFKSNEYAHLLGGDVFEPHEENPMLGFRGASRYISEEFRPSFELECEAIKRVRNEMGLKNLEVMIPFVRTLDEARAVHALLEENQLKRGEDGFRVIMMCEIPSNVILAEQFLEYFDGFSIGSNDLTQLTLGLDRDSGLVASSFDERDPAVMQLLKQAIDACRAQNKYVGICGQGPSDHPDLAEWLLEQGISSISLNPDSVIETWQDRPLAGNYQGNLADVCPVGALTLKEFRFQARVWNLHKVASTCPGCSPSSTTPATSCSRISPTFTESSDTIQARSTPEAVVTAAGVPTIR